MGDLDGWAATVGEASCRYLSGNGHDTFFRGLCSDGASSAGWRLLIFALLLAGVTLLMVRLFKPR